MGSAVDVALLTVGAAIALIMLSTLDIRKGYLAVTFWIAMLAIVAYMIYHERGFNSTFKMKRTLETERDKWKEKSEAER